MFTPALITAPMAAYPMDPGTAPMTRSCPRTPSVMDAGEAKSIPVVVFTGFFAFAAAFFSASSLASATVTS